MKKNVVTTLFVLCAFLVVSPFALSGVVSMKTFSWTLPGAWYYTGAPNGEFALDVAAGSVSDMRSFNAPVNVWDYQIEDVHLVISPMSLISDDSSGTVAAATFAGGGTMTLSGTLKDAGGTFLYSGTLFEAAMQPAITQWTLTETELIPNVLSSLDGSFLMDPTSGPVALANGDTLVIGTMSVSLQFNTPPTVSSFGENLFTPGPAVQILASEAVPEPATMLLLGLGGLLIGRKRN